MSGVRTAELDHVAGQSFLATTGTGRRIAFGDRVEEGELSPVETLAASLAACSAMDVVSILDKKRQRYDRYHIRVTAEQRDEYPQVYTRIDIVHELEGPLLLEIAVRRAIELSATKYCPISATVSAGATEVHHRYHVRCTGAEAFEAEGEAAITGPERRPDPLPPATGQR
ncbi:MAG TPA: OsmC family protein [Candidatus Limnocylindrales bacterium]|jgi:putative redox protein